MDTFWIARWNGLEIMIPKHMWKSKSRTEIRQKITKVPFFRDTLYIGGLDNDMRKLVLHLSVFLQAKIHEYLSQKIKSLIRFSQQHDRNPAIIKGLGTGSGLEHKPTSLWHYYRGSNAFFLCCLNTIEQPLERVWSIGGNHIQIQMVNCQSFVMWPLYLVAKSALFP